MRALLAPVESVSHPKFWEKLEPHYPLLGSPKLDGIRGITGPYGRETAMYSRSWKLLPSPQVQFLADQLGIDWIDGELIEGRATDGDVYNRTQSHVMHGDRPGDISFHAFDYCHPDLRAQPYHFRLEELHRKLLGQGEHIKVVAQTPLMDRGDVEAFEEEQLRLGYEGVMLRTQTGRYKENRATLNEGIIYKLKRTVDAEGVVVGLVERQKNNNEQVLDERGFAKRSSHQAGKQAAGTLGKFKVLFEGRIINVAPGKFSHAQLQEIWDDQDRFVQKLLKFRYFAHGVKDEPRHARALGWRDPIDL